jgi:8-oxo-dGTP pyrophosphatase MutT (NUDIX family)
LCRRKAISQHLRERGTAVVLWHGRVLLVRDKGKHRFSLPGGGVKKGEPTVSAAARELYEELGLRPTSIERLRECDFRGKASKHKVCLVTEFDGHPHIQGHELSEFTWWNMKDNVPVFAHVRFILGKLDKLGKH